MLSDVGLFLVIFEEVEQHRPVLERLVLNKLKKDRKMEKKRGICLKKNPLKEILTGDLHEISIAAITQLL
jgi:hypothetical protein